MLMLLSPSKTLNMDAEGAVTNATQPRLLEESKKLIKVAKGYSADDIKRLMKVSDKIAALNYERFQNFNTPFTAENATPCVLAFKGDVYDGLDAESLDAKSIDYTQAHLRILSGLYGLLRPKDLMQAYRMEMGRKIETAKAKDLYHFWGEQITDLINEDAKASKAAAVLNLASNEYFKAVKPAKLITPLITAHFKEKRGSEYKVLGLYAKRARGMMARYVIEHRIESVDALCNFTEGGYYYASELSDEKNLVFVR